MTFKQAVQDFKSKEELYFTLAVRAQLHLPPEYRCSLEFMKQLLEGTKKALPIDDIRHIRCTDRKYITVKRVVAQVKDNAVYMMYLPDKPGVAGRAFLFNIVNTLDPDYFRVALGEIERMRIAKMKSDDEHQVKICPEMQRVLSQYVNLTVDRRARPQSLAMLKMGAKKRQKVEKKPVPELNTRLK